MLSQRYQFHRFVPATLLLAVLVLLFGATAAHAQAWQARHGLTSAQYQAVFNQLTSQGYRLVQVDGYDTAAGSRYAAIWEKRGGPAWVARHGMTAAQYQKTFNTYTKKGYRPVLVDGHTINGQDLYAAIFEKRNGPAWVARHGMTAAQYQSYFNSYTKQGYRLVYVSGYGGSSARYAAIWEKSQGSAWAARHGLTGAKYQIFFNSYVKRGYRPILIDGYRVGNSVYYAAIFEKRGGPAWVSRHGMTAAQYQSYFNTYKSQGYRPVHVSGNGGNQVGYAAIWSK